MRKSQVITLINQARFLMFRVGLNSLLSEEEFNQQREMLTYIIDDNINTRSRSNVNALDNYIQDLYQLCRGHGVEMTVPIGFSERVDRVLWRLDNILYPEVEEELTPEMREELFIGRVALHNALENIAEARDGNSLLRDYILFIGNRVRAVESWLNAIDNNELPNMDVVQIPSMEYLQHQITPAEVINEVPTTEGGLFSGFFTSIATYTVRLFNNIFIPSNNGVAQGEPPEDAYISPPLEGAQVNENGDAMNALVGTSGWV
jgi:hypothetical protein